MRKIEKCVKVDSGNITTSQILKKLAWLVLNGIYYSLAMIFKSI